MARRVFRSAVAVLVLASIASATVGFGNCTDSFINGFIPSAPTGAVQICREGAIAIAYDVTMIDPAYSAYHITPAQANVDIPGRDDFYLDPDLESLGVKQAHPYSEAFNDKWNKGHLCPNHIMSYSAPSKKATFTMANVAPQGAYFNQHPWEELEEHVRNWIQGHNALHIVTGVAYISRANATRGKEDVAIPDYYFKVICDATAGRSAGFYGSNTQADHAFPTMVTVAAIETLYGGQLFPSTTCNTDSVEPGYWWGSSSSSGSSSSGSSSSAEGHNAHPKDLAHRR